MERWATLLREFSTTYIVASYEELRRVVKENPQEVRDHDDFRQWGRALEAEMAARAVAFDPVTI